MVLQVKMNIEEATRLMTNIRVWMPRYANRTIRAGTKILKRYIRQNIKPHNRTGKLYDSAKIVLSPKQFSGWVIVDAKNARGHYAPAVEEGANNPRTGRKNRPVRYNRRAVDRYAREHVSLVEKKLKETIPKK